MRSIIIIHPTRHRPVQALWTKQKWLGSSDNPDNIEYLMSMDTDDNITPDWVRGLRGQNKTAIEAINNAVDRCTGDIIVVVSDDFDCEPHWDTALLAEIGDKTDFVMKTVDGLQPKLVTLPIMDRVWYERYGYVYHPDYPHMYADQELTAVAEMTGKLIMSNLVFKHLHYSAGLSPFDTVNQKNDATYPQGLEVFNRHLAVNFGIVSPVKKYEEIVW